MERRVPTAHLIRADPDVKSIPKGQTHNADRRRSSPGIK